MSTLTQIIIATTLISLTSLIGVLTLTFKKQFLHKILIFLVSLSAGTMLGGAFLHLLPEATEILDINLVFLVTLISFCSFFLIEKLLHWRHCHKDHCEVHQFGTMNLLGDGIHNFIDGLVIAAAFLTSPALGISTSLAIALHEIPQEIGDFGVMLHSGFSKNKAILANLGVALLALLGGILGYFWISQTSELMPYFLPIAAGGFIYISTSDLIPEIRKEKSLHKSLGSFVVFLVGIGVMMILGE